SSDVCSSDLKQRPELVARMGVILLRGQRRFAGKAAEDQNGRLRIDYRREAGKQRRRRRLAGGRHAGILMQALPCRTAHADSGEYPSLGDYMDRKIIIITGGSRGIGAETAALAASEGYAVCISYLHNRDAAEAVVDSI